MEKKRRLEKNPSLDADERERLEDETAELLEDVKAASTKMQQVGSDE